MSYTIIHPGGLVDKPARERELLVGVDDTLLQLDTRQVPRADVARVACAALVTPEARDVSMDLASKPPGEGAATEHAAECFRGMLAGKSCDYGEAPADPPSLPGL